MVRIVTTMTIIPAREQLVIKAIMSIKNGTIKPDAMYINIPKKYARFEKPLEPWLKPVLVSLGMTVLELDEDRACFNKILPILSFEKDPETLVVTIDDDIEYKPMFIAGLYEAYKSFGGVVGYSGLFYPENSKDTLNYHLFLGHKCPAEIIQQGFGTMTKVASFEGFPHIPPLTKDMDASLYLSDDYVISRFYDFKGLSKYVVCWDQIGRVNDDWSSVCTLLEDDYGGPKLSTDRKSLEDYMRAGEIINYLWKWPYPNTNNVGSS
jgi:hypothetical protein